MILRKNDSGRSIVEMLGVLAIMGVITVMGISGYSQAVGKINRNNAVEQITKIAQEVRSFHAGRNSYNETDESTTEGYDIATNILDKAGVNLISPYGSKYVVKSFGKAGSNPGFYVTMSNISKADCLTFQTMAWNDVMKSDKKTPGSSAYFQGTPGTNVACKGDGQPETLTVYFR